MLVLLHLFRVYISVFTNEGFYRIFPIFSSTFFWVNSQSVDFL